MSLLIHILVNAVAVFISAFFLPGVHVDSFSTAIIVAIVLGLVNIFIKPILVIFTLPITIVTLGLFLFVINAAVILIVDALIPGFGVNGFLWALIFSFVLSITSSILHSVVG